MKLSGWSRLCIVLSAPWGILVLFIAIFAINEIKNRANSNRVRKIGEIIDRIGNTPALSPPSLDAPASTNINLSAADSLCVSVLKDYKHCSPEKLSRLLSNDLKDDLRMRRIQEEYVQEERMIRLLRLKLEGLAFVVWFLPIASLYLVAWATRWVIRGFSKNETVQRT
jgi:superfamily I DNA/RNA helicase